MDALGDTSGPRTATVAAGLACAACVAPLLFARYLPMLDLPQHAAQVAIWAHRDDPRFWPPGVYRLNAFTPYLGAYLVARLFALAVAVPAALKVTVAVALVGVPLSTWVLVRETGGEPWWVLASAPLAFGVSFFSGFLNFLLAIPLIALWIAASLRFARGPTWRRGALVALLGVALAVCHAVAYGVGVVAALAAILAESADRRAAGRHGMVLLIPAPLVALWTVATWAGEAQVRGGLRWSGLPTRPFRLPGVLVGSPNAAVAVAALAGLALIFALLGVRLRFRRAAGAALAALGVLFLVVPDSGFHTFLLPERFAAVLAIVLLSCLRLPEGKVRRRAVVALLVTLVLGWSAGLAIRFRAFDRQMAGLDDLIARMEPGKTVRVVPLDARSGAVPGYPIFWSVGGWYQAEKGGLLGFSFAQLFPSLVRYTATPPWAEPLGVDRGVLEWRPEDAAFDYFVFRSERRDPAEVLPAGPARPRLIARSGDWWLYGKAPPPA